MVPFPSKKPLGAADLDEYLVGQRRRYSSAASWHSGSDRLYLLARTIPKELIDRGVLQTAGSKHNFKFEMESEWIPTTPMIRFVGACRSPAPTPVA